MTKDYCRTEVYTHPRSGEPKHMFIWLCDKLEKENKTPQNILDVGAASGDFLRYTASRFPEATCEGIEYDTALVEYGTNNSKGLFKISHGDANHLTSIPTDTYTAVFMTGTHSIFDDFRASFSECIRVAKPGGVILITGLFNDFPLDARIHWRYPGDFDGDWHPGYNLFSKQSINTYLSTIKGVSHHEFQQFVLPFDLEPCEDPVRSWTEKSGDDKRYFRNGIMPLNLELLLIRKKEKA